MGKVPFNITEHHAFFFEKNYQTKIKGYIITMLLANQRLFLLEQKQTKETKTKYLILTRVYENKVNASEKFVSIDIL